MRQLLIWHVIAIFLVAGKMGCGTATTVNTKSITPLDLDTGEENTPGIGKEIDTEGEDTSGIERESDSNEDKRYHLTLHVNGNPHGIAIWNVEGRPGNPAPGDLAWVADTPFLLGAPGHYDFELNASAFEVYRIYRVAEDGRRVLFSVDWTGSLKDDVEETSHPLSFLSELEQRAIRSLTVTPRQLMAHPSLLNNLDLNHLCVMLSNDSREEGNLDPAAVLPPGLQCLIIALFSATKAFNLKNISQLKELRHLFVLGDLERLDMAHLSGLRKLRSLKISGSKVENLEALSALTQLRRLEISLKSIRDLSFAGSFQELHFLDISNTRVQSLGPLSDLVNLNALNASSTPISKLSSTGFEALTLLEIYGTPLSTRKVLAFKESHPKCKVRFFLENSLKQELEGVDKLQIRGGGCNYDPNNKSVFYETNDKSEIEEFVNMIQIKKPQKGKWFHVMCSGDVAFQFYRDGELLVSLGYHINGPLSWEEWPSDADLKPKSAKAIAAWLEERQMQESLNATKCDE